MILLMDVSVKMTSLSHGEWDVTAEKGGLNSDGGARARTERWKRGIARERSV